MAKAYGNNMKPGVPKVSHAGKGPTMAPRPSTGKVAKTQPKSPGMGKK